MTHTHHKDYINSLKLQNRIFKTVLFLSVVGGVLYATKPEVVSPCVGDEPCSQKVIYQVKNLTIEEQLLVEGARTFGLDQVLPLKKLVFKESSLNSHAVNPSSGACGLFQALPCSKMKCSLGDSECQITWGLGYIKNRYGTPEKALSFHLEHNWY